MTDIVTAVTAPVVMMPFDTLPPDQLYGSGVPRAVCFVNHPFSSVGTGAGDTELLSIDWQLPSGYMYRPLDLRLTAGPSTTARLNDWTAAGTLNYGASQYEPNGRTQKVHEGTYWQSVAGTGSDGYLKQWKPSVADDASAYQLLDGRTATGSLLNMTLFNASASTAVVPFQISGRWLQYDISEGFAWPIWYVGNALS